MFFTQVAVAAKEIDCPYPCISRAHAIQHETHRLGDIALIKATAVDKLLSILG